MTTAIDQQITCSVSGLSQDTPIVFVDPDDADISTDDTDNYVINEGQFLSGSKTSFLTITQQKLSELASGSVFKCKLKSTLYPTQSPDVIAEMTLTFLGLSETFIF